jgi:hypothetical protein
MKRQAMTAMLGVAALAAILVACASEATNGTSGGDAKPVDRYRCFNPTFLRGFETPSNDRLIIESDNNQAYELAMAGPCFGLDDSLAIGIRSHTGMGEICDPLDADIIFHDNAMGGRRECRVMTMRHLSGDEAAKYVTPRKAAAAAAASSSSVSSPAH